MLWLIFQEMDEAEEMEEPDMDMAKEELWAVYRLSVVHSVAMDIF